MDDKDQHFVQFVARREHQKTFEKAAVALIQSVWKHCKAEKSKKKSLETRLFEALTTFGALRKKQKRTVAAAAAAAQEANASDDLSRRAQDRSMLQFKQENKKTLKRLKQMERKIELLIQKATEAVDAATPA